MTDSQGTGGEALTDAWLERAEAQMLSGELSGMFVNRDAVLALIRECRALRAAPPDRLDVLTVAAENYRRAASQRERVEALNELAAAALATTETTDHE